MKIIIIAFVLLSIGPTTSGQQSTLGTLSGKPVDVKTGSGTVLTQLPMAPPKTDGDVYLHSDWTLANIKLASETTVLEGYPVKLDLQSNSLEIQYLGQVKVLSGARVSHFILVRNDGTKEKYINAKGYRINDSPIVGFLHVVDSGKWMLLVKKELRVIESSYNPALAVGKRDNEIVKDDKVFFGKQNMLYETDLSVKKFCKQFPRREAILSKFIKEEKINLKKVGDLTKLLAFLNAHV